MPRSKNARSYPSEFGKLIQRAFLGENVQLQYPSYKRAKSMQGTLYGYLTAVKANPEDFLEFLDAAHQVSFSVSGDPKTDGPATLTVYNKENSWQAQSIREALGLQKESELIAQSADRLIESLKGDTPANVGNPDTPFTYSEAPGPSVSLSAEEIDRAREKSTGYLGRAPRT